MRVDAWRIACCVIATAAMNANALAADAWIVTHSRESVAEAVAEAGPLLGRTDYPVRVFRAKNGVYAVAIGPDEKREIDGYRRTLLKRGMIPGDSFISASGDCCVESIKTTPGQEYEFYEKLGRGLGESRLGIVFGESVRARNSAFVAVEVKELIDGNGLEGTRVAPGDWVISADGYVFPDTDALKEYLTNRPVGAEVELELLTWSRDGRPRGYFAIGESQPRERIAQAPQRPAPPAEQERSVSEGPSAGQVAAGAVGLAILACLTGLICGSSSSSSQSSSSGQSSEEREDAARKKAEEEGREAYRIQKCAFAGEC